MKPIDLLKKWFLSIDPENFYSDYEAPDRFYYENFKCVYEQNDDGSIKTISFSIKAEPHNLYFYNLRDDIDIFKQVNKIITVINKRRYEKQLEILKKALNINEDLAKV